ncbi:imidazolonepropionase [Amnibacterium kyonggiense]|uniref:Imidazolonepropionase n=1 Tax=Amnibacterium kyonggiense TaxID=595671 RepID=A0A4R7FLX9_9MICO|nr:imidazolonepropionase [Amnibacterium kyonggiense]TDS77431.1 imidazolonepropionase [Amnibacterium kyonggiense]
MSELLTGIAELTTHDGPTPAESTRLTDAAVVVEDGRVAWLGPASTAPAADVRTDLGGRAVLPGWVDCHTHLVFAGDRAAEFAARLDGRPYAAGGIATTVEATRAASDEELRAAAARLRAEALAGGTTTLETKTGYGLDVHAEVRLARIGREVADSVTFLGAHLVPPGVDRRAYLDLVVGPMLDAVRPLVDAIDVFCETGAFTVDEAREVLLAGRAAGLRLRVHGGQLGESGGVALAAELGAASVDHVNHVSAADVDALAGARVTAVLLPAADLSTREPLAPARRLADAGVPLAIATNCNPGSSFTTSMAFCVATAVLQQRLSVAEALWAATRGGAAVLGVDDRGAIRVGGPADLHVLDAPSAAHLAYRPGVPLTHRVLQGARG